MRTAKTNGFFALNWLNALKNVMELFIGYISKLKKYSKPEEDFQEAVKQLSACWNGIEEQSFKKMFGR
jgi:hypothetical protein